MHLSQAWVTAHSQTPFILRRRFTLSQTPRSACLKACGLGQFNAFLNGSRVGDSFLDPAWTDYNKLVLYVSFDVTARLRAGENALVLEVGNGWYLWDTSLGYSFHFPPFMPPNPIPIAPSARALSLPSS